jgi:HK97 family phage prohead protease
VPLGTQPKSRERHRPLMGERMTMERRALVAAPELRAGDKGKTIAGYAALFNSETADIGGMFREDHCAWRLHRDAEGRHPRAGRSRQRARYRAHHGGHASLERGRQGLAAEIDLPDTTDGRDLAVSLERGDISGMSFGFRVTHDEWDETTSPIPHDPQGRSVRGERGCVPAYADTELALRSLKDDQGKREIGGEERRRRQGPHRGPPR